MSTTERESIQNLLEKARKVLEDTGETIDRLTVTLEPIERSLALREFQSRTKLDPGESRVVLCIEEELAVSKPFRKALSKLDSKKPTLVKIPEETASRMTTLTVARMIPSEVLSKEEGQVIVANIQKEYMLKPLERAKTVILGERYYLDSGGVILGLANAMKKLNLNVLTDNGLRGGGALTYELVRTLRDRPLSSVVELTLSCSVSENTDALQRLVEALLSL